MSDQQFKVGDKVRLKSGSPVMAIETIGDGTNPTIYCVWFDRPSQLELWTGPHRASFNAGALVMAPDDAKNP